MGDDCGLLSQWGVSSVKLQMALEVLLELLLQLQLRLSLAHHASKNTFMLVKFRVLYISATVNQLSCKFERSSEDIKIGFNSILFAFSPCVYSWLVQLITDVMLQALVQPSSPWANYLWKLKIEINYESHKAYIVVYLPLITVQIVY